MIFYCLRLSLLMDIHVVSSFIAHIQYHEDQFSKCPLIHMSGNFFRDTFQKQDFRVVEKHVLLEFRNSAQCPGVWTGLHSLQHLQSWELMSLTDTFCCVYHRVFTWSLNVNLLDTNKLDIFLQVGPSGISLYILAGCISS